MYWPAHTQLMMKRYHCYCGCYYHYYYYITGIVIVIKIVVVTWMQACGPIMSNTSRTIKRWIKRARQHSAADLPQKAYWAGASKCTFVFGPRDVHTLMLPGVLTDEQRCHAYSVSTYIRLLSQYTYMCTPLVPIYGYSTSTHKHLLY